MCMTSSTAGYRRGLFHIEDGWETRENGALKKSASDGNRGGDTNSRILHAPSEVVGESRRAAEPKCATVRLTAAHWSLANDEEPGLKRGNDKYRARDAVMLAEELVGGKSTQRLQVVVRIRPAEDVSAARMATVLLDRKTVCLVPAPAKKGCKEQLEQGRSRQSRRELRATFDRVLGESADQSEVYDQVRACVRYAFLGVNACVLAYGQTGSGKTYTMMGDARGQDASVRLARGTSQRDVGRFSESMLVQPLGEASACDEQSDRSACDTREERVVVSSRQEGVIPRAVRDIFFISQRVFGASTSAARALLSSLPVKQNDLQAAETQRATSSSVCTPRLSRGTDGGSGCDSKSNSASSYSDEFQVDQPSPTRRSFIEQSGCLDLRQQRKQGQREGSTALDDGTSMLTHESRRGARPGTSCTVEMSYIQIYNDRVYDLLSDEVEQKPLSVLDSASNLVAGMEATDSDCPTAGWGAVGQGTRQGNCVLGLSVHHVEDAEQALRILRRGDGNRRVRSTEMNANSSRSHCILQFTVSTTTTKSIRETLSGAGKPGAPDLTGVQGDSDKEHDAGSQASTPDPENVVTTRATLSLVDLAGSERGGIGVGGVDSRELERKRINASLSALSNCINRLAEVGRTHVPFRDSPLNRLLRGSLEGGKTILIATISPTVDSQAESISTLHFAARCTRVVVRQRVNEVTSDALLLRRARSQISALRRRLRQLETTCTTLERSPPSATPASASSGSRAPVFAYDGKTEDVAKYQKGKPSAATPSGAEVERKRSFHDSAELDHGKLGSDDLGPRGVSQSAAETGGGQLHRSTGKYNRNDEAPDSVKKTIDARRSRDLMIHSRSQPEGRSQRSANLNAVWNRGDCTTLKCAINSKGWKPRTGLWRSRKHAPTVERDDADAVAMAALLERFSSREEELLREIKSWKAKCKRVERESRERDCDATDVLTGRSDCKRSASSTMSTSLSRRARAVGPGSADRGDGPGGSSEAAARMAIAQTRYPRGGERSASPRRQESKDIHRERRTVLDSILPGRKEDLELRQGEAVEVRGRRKKGWHPRDLSPRNYVEKSPVDGAGQVLVSAIPPTSGHRSSGAQIRIGSDDAGGGRFSTTHGPLGSDRVTRKDVDRHMSSRWVVGKTDCLAENAAELSAWATDRAVPSWNTRFILRSRSSNTASSASFDPTSIHVRSVCLGRDHLLPRNSSELERPTSTRTFMLTTAQTAADYRHNTDTGDDDMKTPSGGLLKHGVVGRERNTEIPNVGEPSHSPTHGHWSATHGISQPANVTIRLDRGNPCGRHGLSCCVLCGDSYFHLDGKLSSSNASPVGESTKRAEEVKIVASAPPVLIDVTGDESCGTCSLEEHRLSAASVVMISRETECMPCVPHLLPNCVLCKMQKARLGRSASFPALGPTPNGAGKTDILASSRLRISKHIARRKNHCDPHDLSDCLLCGDPDSTAPVSKSDRSDPRGVHGSVEPLLPGHSPSFSQPRQEMRPNTSPRLFKVSPKSGNHGKALDAPALTTAGAPSAEGTPRIFASNSNDEDAVPPQRRSRFPPAVGPRCSGISRRVSDDNPLIGNGYACYNREIAKRYAGDACADRNRGERQRHGKSLAQSRQLSSLNTGNRWPGGMRTDAVASGLRLRESDSDINDLAAKALMAARAFL